MRCPKCGYISFDHAENCTKCKKDIAGSTEVEGTTYQASAPSFLKIPGAASASVDDSESSSEIAFDGGEEEFDFSDPDLDVLVGDEGQIEFEDADDGEEVISFEEAELGDAKEDFQIESDDGGGFDFELEGDDDEPIAAPSLDLPDSLADISDLAPPAPAAASPAPSGGMNLSLDDEVSLDEDLDLDGLDLDLGLGGDTPVAGEELSLSLDDIDLSADDDGGMGDLSMDLDLGGLGDTPAPKKEKSSGSLDDLSLSLD